MSDFGLLSNVRDVLKENETIQHAGISSRIYFSLPPVPTYPCLLVETDSIWEDETACLNQAVARINFHINLLTQVHMGPSPKIVEDAVEGALDAHSLRLSSDYLANFRKTSTVIDLPMMRSPRVFQQFFQAVIWNKKESNTSVTNNK